MSCHEYSYCFLRYRRDRESDEFANVGVLLWAPTLRYLAFQGSKKFSRLTHFFGDIDKSGYRLLLSHVERRFDAMAQEALTSRDELALERLPRNARELAIQVVPEDEGAIDWSTPRGGLTADPEAKFNAIFEHFIGRLNEPREPTRRDDSQVFREVYRQALSAPNVAPFLCEHEIVAPLASHVFKHAWKNGVWNVYETLSFDMSDTDSIERKAHTWFGRSVHLAESVDRPKLHYLLGKPMGNNSDKAYANAKAILKSAGDVVLVEEEEATDFARELEAKLGRESAALD